MAEISKIQLPSGNIYELRDDVARQAIAGGISFIIAWDGSSVPVPANIPAGVEVTYNGTKYTGTLAATDAQAGAFYLIKETTTNPDNYSEYVVVGSGNAKRWEKLGNVSIDLSFLGELASKDSVTLNKGAGDSVLGSDTTFTAASSTVNFTGETTDEVLGANTNFTVTQPTITVTPTTTHVKATASNTVIAAQSQATAITDLGNPTTDTAIKSLSVPRNRLETTLIPVISTTTSVVASITPNISKLETTTIPNVTDAGSASTFAFTVTTDNDGAPMLSISGSNSVAPTLGTAITAATGTESIDGTGATILTGVRATPNNNVPSWDGQQIMSVATGEVSNRGSGAQVVTSVAPDETITTVTALGTPTTDTVLKSVAVTSEPTITLSTSNTQSAGSVEVMTDATATASNGAVSADSSDVVTVLTDIGSATAEAQQITVGANDRVNAAKYEDLSITVE